MLVLVPMMVSFVVCVLIVGLYWLGNWLLGQTAVWLAVAVAGLLLGMAAGSGRVLVWAQGQRRTAKENLERLVMGAFIISSTIPLLLSVGTAVWLTSRAFVR